MIAFSVLWAILETMTAEEIGLFIGIALIFIAVFVIFMRGKK
jgi:hypothetical protein